MSPRIGLIIGSTRRPRICDQIADFVLQSVHPALFHANNTAPTIRKIDLAEWNLPMFDEPVLPQKVFSAQGYVHEHTRAWSREIADFDAFIFVSPQYNRSIPASLKNALDYLFNEWSNKPAMLVTYGGHGGAFAAEHLATVFNGLKIQLMPTRVELVYPSKEFVTTKALAGADLGLDSTADDSLWAEKRPTIVAAFEELKAALAEKTATATGPSDSREGKSTI